MAIVTGDRYLESLVKFVENEAGRLIEGGLILKLNPVGLHYVQSRLEALAELESLLDGAPVDYLRAYVSDLGDHRALEQLRRILRLLTSLKVVSVLPLPSRDPTPLSLLPFGRLKLLELRGCDLSTSTARGLLELRLTLEKIICHNSTDALRHVFASRIVEIKDSPQWNRLSFVSCACNGLLLMDESLQLLPAVETLDLSRNKFAKVDNLRKCTKLKHLDLGFNHLRTIASFGEVSSQIVKLVLRNNALTTLRGIEKLKSLVGLDISYNIISNFFELEILADLPSLENLWLEGNPLCSARWYRAQVFSFFPHPDKLKLDEKKICTEEFWKRQLVIASRQKRPASFGFYSPAKDKAELEGSINTKRKKITRLASIDFDGRSTFVCSDQESVSCDIEIQSKEENVISDEEAEIVDLMNRIEFMKKERSNLWLQEFQVWMNQTSENLADGIKHNGVAPNHDKEENYLKNSTRHKHVGESSRYVSDSVQASGDESSTNFLESDNSFADISTGFSTHQYCDRLGEASSKFFMEHTGQDSMPVIERIEPKQKHLKSHRKKGCESINIGNSRLDSFAVPEGDRISVKNSFTSLGGIDDIMVSNSSLACPGSPPHYQEDILHRRHNLVEEFLQLSAESYSVASSDSNTSHSEDDSSELGSSIPRFDKSLLDELSERSVDGHSSVISSVDSSYDQRHEVSQLAQNGKSSLYPEQTSGTMEVRDTDLSLPSCRDRVPARGRDNEIVRLVKKEANWLEKKKCKRKPIKRVVSLSEEHNMDEREPLHKLNGSLNDFKVDVEDELGKKLSHGSDFQKSIAASHTNNSGKVLAGTNSSSLGTDDLIVNYFNSNIADFKIQETCRLCMSCNCMLEEKYGGKESEVAVILSSERKLYILITDGIYDGSGTSLRLIGCHRIEDVKEVLVGLGLQVVRVRIERDATYMFITGSIEKSRQLLCILDFFNLHAKEEDYSLRSLEQVQVELFERHVCGASKINMFQYSIVLFQHINMEDDMWLSRSLFVLGRHLLLCVEDFVQFGSLLEDVSSSSYFSLASCCSIVDVLEMVLETGKSRCVTLSLKCAMSEFCHLDVSDEMEDALLPKNKAASVPVTWKLKWLCEENQVKFVALLKALYSASTMSPLVVRYV